MRSAENGVENEVTVTLISAIKVTVTSFSFQSDCVNVTQPLAVGIRLTKGGSVR